MKKILFLFATAYLIIYIMFLIPAYATSPKFYEHRYSATEKEKTIIKDVYEHTTTQTTISIWSFFGLYGLFAISMFCDRKKNPDNA